MNRTRLLLATLAVVLGLTLVPAVPAQAKLWGPDGGATFNVPDPWGGKKQNFRIVHKVERAIRNAQPNSAILVTSYLMDRWDTTNALIAACRRGVRVRVILDSGVVGRPAKKLINYLNADNRVHFSEVTTWKKVKPKDGKHRKGAKKRRKVVKQVREAAPRGPCNTITPARRAAIVQRVTERFREERAAEKPARAKRSKAQREKRREAARRELAQRRSRALARAQRPLGRQIRLSRARRMAKKDLSTKASWGPDGSYVKMCSGACRSDHGAMHTKFYAFSRTGNARRVVMVSSSNLNRGGANLGWNDLWTMKSAKKAYARYRMQHRAMTSEQRGTRAGVSFRTKGGTQHRFYPRLAGLRRTDPVMRDLQQLRCATRHKGKKVFSRIHVNMFWWSGRRGMALANQLVRLGRRGCHVNVIVGAPARKVMKRLKRAARSKHLHLHDSRWDFWGDELPDIRSHMKTVLVRGRYGKKKWVSRVFTGSANWTGGGLQFSDENTITLTYRGAYDSYLANWKKIRKHSRPYRG